MPTIKSRSAICMELHNLNALIEGANFEYFKEATSYHPKEAEEARKKGLMFENMKAGLMLALR